MASETDPDSNAKQLNAGEIQVSGSDNAPDFYVDGHRGALFANGVVRLLLVRSRLTDSGTTNQAVCHLMMSAESLVKFHSALGKLISDLREDGNIPSDVIADEDQNGNKEV